MTEGRDWTRSQYEACAECGADASRVADGELRAELLREVAAWGRTLARADSAARRARPEPDVWSALEYACHVRDLLPVMTERVGRTRREDNPALGWWDHESAVTEERYNEQDPVLVLEAIGESARCFATVLAEMAPDEWDRVAIRRAGEQFTIRGLARFVLHEVIHHRHDAEQSLRHAQPESPRDV